MPAPRPIAALAAACALSGAIASSGCNEQSIVVVEPEIRLSESSVDFGDVRLGFYRRLSIAIYNDGAGWLQIEDITFRAGSYDGFTFGWPVLEVAPGKFTELPLEYVPTHEGTDLGTITVRSDDPAAPEVELFLAGAGVLPQVAVEPSLLYFPTTLETPPAQEVRVSSVGSGPLTVSALSLEAGDAAFQVTLPESVDLPFVLEPGLILSVAVAFVPADEAAHSDRLVVETDDPDAADAAWPVDLVAAGEPPDDENQAPIVLVTAPAEGSAAHAGAEVVFVGQVADPDDPPESLAILWQSDVDGYVGTGVADASGAVSLPISDLTPGLQLVTLIARDPEGAEGADSVSVLVWDDDDELVYTLAGGPTPYHFFHVDDDMEVLLNGSPILRDDDGWPNSHAPFEFVAHPGDLLRVVATDAQSCTKSLDALVLHFSGGASQALNDPISVSACVTHPDYDPAYDGPWPNDFLDETWEIAIP